VATVGKFDGIVTAISLGATTVTGVTGAFRATASVSVIPTAGALSGTFAFTRMTLGIFEPLGNHSPPVFDLLTFSGGDRTPRSVPRPAEFASIAAPAWSPDGTLLAVEVMHAYFPYDWGDYNRDVYVMSATGPAGAPWRALTANGLSRSPSWSPDGKRIAYLKQTRLWAYSSDIYVIDAAGGTPVRLTGTDGDYGTLRWSPSGTRLAFTSGEGNDSEIFVVNANGSGLTNVSRSGAAYDPSWSPDDARLTFVSDRGGLRESVFVVDRDGSNLRRLTSLTDHCWGPACSPDGQQIIVPTDGALLVKNADGSSLARLIKTPLTSWDTAPIWRR
jgi:Tol biopolymer transport system component